MKTISDHYADKIINWKRYEMEEQLKKEEKERKEEYKRGLDKHMRDNVIPAIVDVISKHTKKNTTKGFIIEDYE